MSKKDKQAKRNKSKQSGNGKLLTFNEKRIRCFHYAGDSQLFYLMYQLEKALQQIELLLNADTILGDGDWKHKRQLAVDVYTNAAKAVADEFVSIMKGYLPPEYEPSESVEEILKRWVAESEAETKQAIDTLNTWKQATAEGTESEEGDGKQATPAPETV